MNSKKVQIHVILIYSRSQELTCITISKQFSKWYHYLFYFGLLESGFIFKWQFLLTHPSKLPNKVLCDWKCFSMYSHLWSGENIILHILVWTLRLTKCIKAHFFLPTNLHITNHNFMHATVRIFLVGNWKFMNSTDHTTTHCHVSLLV